MDSAEITCLCSARVKTNEFFFHCLQHHEECILNPEGRINYPNKDTALFNVKIQDGQTFIIKTFIKSHHIYCSIYGIGLKEERKFKIEIYADSTIIDTLEGRVNEYTENVSANATNDSYLYSEYKWDYLIISIEKVEMIIKDLNTIESLKCCICKQYLVKSPMYLCYYSKHISCKKCASGASKCSCEDSGFDEFYNSFFYSALDKSLFACKFSCNRSFKIKNLQEHELNCKFKK